MRYHKLEDRLDPHGGALYTKDGVIAFGRDAEETRKYLNEAEYFKNRLRGYLATEGQLLLQYFTNRGEKLSEIAGVGSLELEDRVIAAVIKGINPVSGKESVIIVSNGSKGGFKLRAQRFADKYGLPIDWAEEYILAHEVVRHAMGVDDEARVEQDLKEAYSYLAEMFEGHIKYKYSELARVAAIREKEAKATLETLLKAA